MTMIQSDGVHLAVFRYLLLQQLERADGEHRRKRRRKRVENSALQLVDGVQNKRGAFVNFLRLANGEFEHHVVWV
ncbi:hypothetical protein U1Q18_017497 [Sarracenia purpurea var. burkii]